ncbi:MAG TPA: helix-turn-helix transcriptional regulator [Planctomycetota bacterium]|nr:helix-turn-helix transcriptional regulator [Planctomycetota bacterium]
MPELNPSLMLPADAGRLLAERVKALRLLRGWKRTTLAERSGVTAASLKRFETTGLVSLESLLKLAHALGRLPEFAELLRPPEARSIAELEGRYSIPARKRGRL